MGIMITHIMRVPLSLNNSTEDIANGKVGSWTSNKTMKVCKHAIIQVSFQWLYTGTIGRALVTHFSQCQP